MGSSRVCGWHREMLIWLSEAYANAASPERQVASRHVLNSGVICDYLT